MSDDKVVQKQFKHFKELNRILRLYFDAYIIDDEYIWGHSIDPYTERFVKSKDIDLGVFNHTLISPNSVYDDIKDTRQTKMKTIQTSDSISIIDIESENISSANIFSSIPYISSDQRDDSKNKFYTKLFSMIDSIKNIDSIMRPFDEDLYIELMNKRPVIFDIDSVKIRINKFIFPYLKEKNHLSVGLIGKGDGYRQYIIFKEEYDLIDIYSLFATLTLE